jgi:hypothetical protein
MAKIENLSNFQGVQILTKIHQKIGFGGVNDV